ncbi:MULTISPECIES: KEOPS complex subunit Cgi121 [Haloarcula]|uniref:KEOPS complex component n=1 Tax=Haloarcula pellucida TaxID=1427151 RepID=A0A830GSV9_9EURY|nr:MULTISPECIES: KEOPS complex subunit Cgi121 [Halomicroarcula]MBX0349375.1 KEOPS complex subunit Cgi121 [Halomicroarcula pellucida]MDS0279039.1 KEOPS complex subunit Cgi121 [Halomicroarcula sp. S1AR25-4]GGO03243.1 KEOPS complex component [Halomicroarcula pellucida]
MEVVDGIATIEDVAEFVTELDAIGERYDATVQAFDARYVVDRSHLERAVALAERARERGDTIADDFGVEILLYAAGRRQINRALAMGVSEGECPVVAVVVGGDEAGAAEALQALLESGETLDEYDPERVRSFFDVSDAELAATDGTLADAVRERVALLPVEK